MNSTISSATIEVVLYHTYVQIVLEKQTDLGFIYIYIYIDPSWPDRKGCVCIYGSIGSMVVDDWRYHKHANGTVHRHPQSLAAR